MEDSVEFYVGLGLTQIVAIAMIDRLVHHAEILSLKGESYRLKDHNLATQPAETD